jgi:hypothetical protein
MAGTLSRVGKIVCTALAWNSYKQAAPRSPAAGLKR